MFIALTSDNPHLAAFVKYVDVQPVHLKSTKLLLHLSLLSNLRSMSSIMLSTILAGPAPSSTLPPSLELFALSTHALFMDDQRPTQAFRDTVKLVNCGEAVLWFLTRETNPFPSCRHLYVRWSGSDDDQTGLLHAPPDCSSVECLRWDLIISLHQLPLITMFFPSLRVFWATVPFDGEDLQDLPNPPFPSSFRSSTIETLFLETSSSGSDDILGFLNATATFLASSIS